jgi:hypothetical protein
VFAGVEACHVYVEEARLGVLEGGLGGRCEVRPAGANPDDQVGLAGRAVRREGARRADGAQRARMVVGQGALARLRLSDGDAGAFAQAPQRFRGLRVDDATAGHDHGPAGSTDHGHSTVHCPGIWQRASYVPDSFLEELFRILEGLRLHVLREREGDGPRLGLVREHAHRCEGGAYHLLGA